MKNSTDDNRDICLDFRSSVQDFLDLTIENNYSKEDIMYFLNEAYSSRIFRKTSRKYVYLVHKKPLSSVIVKIWFERGIFRIFKNFVKGGSRAVREAKNMMLLKKYGLGTPPIVSYGNYTEKNVKGHISFIITEQLVGVQTYAAIVEKLYSGEC